MSFENIVVGDYGQTAQLTFIDVDTKSAADISGYTTAQQMVFTAPNGTVTAKAAAFNGTGTDGLIDYTVDSGFFDTAGTWKVRGRVTSGSAELTSVEYSFEVGSPHHRPSSPRVCRLCSR
jgi:hypothetical protein